jgi:hypothetical protein
MNWPAYCSGLCLSWAHSRAIPASDRGRVPLARPREPATPVEVENLGTWVGGEVAREPLLDPEGERIRA